jgi:hypothetical protein
VRAAILPLVVALLLGAPSEKELTARRDKLLAEPWVKANAWVKDYDEALAAAKKEGKPVFAYFTRSYSP